MADTSNLSQFLTDVADAIRTKKETTEPIAAEQFDQEILSIETGIDTSDATATADDIAKDKTAYINGQKVTGTIRDITAGNMMAYNSSSVTQAGSGIAIDARAKVINNIIYRTNSYMRMLVNHSDIAKCVGLTADKLVKGNTILGVEGTAETSSGDIPVKLFATKEEMLNDPSKKLGDLALCYNNTSEPVTETSRFKAVKIHKQFTLDSAQTTSGSIIYSNGVDDWSDEISSKLVVNIYSTSAQVSCSSGSGMGMGPYKSLTVNYTSTDGLTYITEDISEDTIFVFDMEVWKTSTAYKDGIQKICEKQNYDFTGVFECKNYIDENLFYLYKLADFTRNDDNTFSYTGSTPELVDFSNIETIFSDIKAELGLEIDGYEYLILLDADNNWNIIFGVTSDEYIGVIDFYAYPYGSEKCILADTEYNYSTEQRKYYRYIVDLENGSYRSADLPAGNVFSDMNYGELRAFNVDFISVKFVSSSEYYGEGRTISNQGFQYYTAENSSTGWWVDDENPANPVLTDYIYADTQLTISESNELLEGIIAYGPNGIVEGDGTVFDSLTKDYVQDNIFTLQQHNSGRYAYPTTLPLYKNQSYSPASTKQLVYLKKTDDSHADYAIYNPDKIIASPVMLGTTDDLYGCKNGDIYRKVPTHTVSFISSGLSKQTTMYKYNKSTGVFDTYSDCYVAGSSTNGIFYGKPISSTVAVNTLEFHFIDGETGADTVLDNIFTIPTNRTWTTTAVFSQVLGPYILYGTYGYTSNTSSPGQFGRLYVFNTKTKQQLKAIDFVDTTTKVSSSPSLQAILDDNGILYLGVVARNGSSWGTSSLYKYDELTNTVSAVFENKQNGLYGSTLYCTTYGAWDKGDYLLCYTARMTNTSKYKFNKDGSAYSYYSSDDFSDRIVHFTVDKNNIRHGSYESGWYSEEPAENFGAVIIKDVNLVDDDFVPEYDLVMGMFASNFYGTASTDFIFNGNSVYIEILDNGNLYSYGTATCGELDVTYLTTSNVADYDYVAVDIGIGSADIQLLSKVPSKGMMSQTEYNTALETAQDILGKEVTE